MAPKSLLLLTLYFSFRLSWLWVVLSLPPCRPKTGNRPISYFWRLFRPLYKSWPRFTVDVSSLSSLFFIQSVRGETVFPTLELFPVMILLYHFPLILFSLPLARGFSSSFDVRESRSSRLFHTSRHPLPSLPFFDLMIVPNICRAVFIDSSFLTCLFAFVR